MGERYAATMDAIDEQATDDRQATPSRDAVAASAPKEES
jgi:hypothetical protein